LRWIDEHKLVKFVEEGRDVDMDRIMESHSAEQQKEEKDDALDAPKEEASKVGSGMTQ